MRHKKSDCEKKEDDGVKEPTYMGCYCDGNCNPGNIDKKSGRDLPKRLPGYLNPKDCLKRATQ
jgi:hypothetical protein